MQCMDATQLLLQICFHLLRQAGGEYIGVQPVQDISISCPRLPRPDPHVPHVARPGSFPICAASRHLPFPHPSVVARHAISCVKPKDARVHSRLVSRQFLRRVPVFVIAVAAPEINICFPRSVCGFPISLFTGPTPTHVTHRPLAVPAICEPNSPRELEHVPPRTDPIDEKLLAGACRLHSQHKHGTILRFTQENYGHTSIVDVRLRPSLWSVAKKLLYIHRPSFYGRVLAMRLSPWSP